MAHYATPNIHAPTLREEFGDHLPTPKPSPSQVEVGGRGEAVALVGGLPAVPLWVADGDANALRKRYSTMPWLLS